MCEISHQSAPELEVAQTLDEWEVTCKGGVGGGGGVQNPIPALYSWKCTIYKPLSSNSDPDLFEDYTW